MTIDIRAVCSCSAGELISASISDSYRAEAGLIYQRGSCTVRGMNALPIGTPVTFSYQGTIRGGSIQRRLLVLGSSVDGLREVTNLELGCDLTLLSNVREDKVYTRTGVGDPSFDDTDARIVTVPLLADDIANALLAELGISGSCGLSNKFSVAEFDVSGGYVQVLSDLLQSECKVGYMSTGGSLVVQDVLGGSSGKSFDATSVIEMQPLSIGAVPAAKTIVNYSTRTLKQPEETDPEKLNWEKEEVYGVPTTVQVENPFWAEGPAGIVTEARPQYFRYTYTPYTLIQRTYDTLDRLTTQVTTEYTIMAEVAPGYVQHICGRYFVGHSGPKKQLTPPQGSSVYTIITTETTTYKVAAPSIFAQDAELPTGYEEVDKAETIVSEPVLKLVGSTQIYTSAGDLNIEFDYGQSNGTRFISEKQIRRSEQSQGSQRQQVTKSTTERYLCQAYTQVGQQALAEAINKNAGDAAFFNNGAAIAMFVGAQSLKPLGTESQIASGREIGLQQRPPEGARTTNSTTVEASSESEVISGTGFGTQSFTLPYAPDDAFVKTGSTYTAVKSDAAKKARAYGTAQNKMRAGMRHGVNVKAAAYACGGPPGGSAAVSVGGVAVFGLAEGVSYTMDSNGVVVSVDVVPLGTAGSV